ncbi:MAG: hypothetical protein ACP5VR_03575 [Acidimicrobiales bacterium]
MSPTELARLGGTAGRLQLAELGSHILRAGRVPRGSLRVVSPAPVSRPLGAMSRMSAGTYQHQPPNCN